MTIPNEPDNSVLGHEKQWEMFSRAVSRGRLGHAYLLTGPSGIGKRCFALALSQCLLCQTGQNLDAESGLLSACGECPGCRQVISGTHPDLITLGLPEGRTELPIELFVGRPEKRGREGLCHDLSLSPMQGGYRIAIIDDADKMNAASANALLKTLEEPGPGSILILIAVDADQVIQTIRSRCQQVYFNPLAESQIFKVIERLWLAESGDHLNEVDIKQAVKQAEGSVQRAWKSLELRHETSNEIERAIDSLLNQSRMTAAALAQLGNQIIEQAGSDANSKREAAHRFLEICLRHFHQRVVNLTDSHPMNNQQRDVYLDVLDRCFVADFQIEQKANVALVIDSFCDDVENRLRPTWKMAAEQS